MLHFLHSFSLLAGFSRTHARVCRDNSPTRARTPVSGGTRTWSRYAEAANRPVYTALNMFRIDLGSPNYGWFARSHGACSRLLAWWPGKYGKLILHAVDHLPSSSRALSWEPNEHPIRPGCEDNPAPRKVAAREPHISAVGESYRPPGCAGA
jgi:hypothetical protein